MDLLRVVIGLVMTSFPKNTRNTCLQLTSERMSNVAPIACRCVFRELSLGYKAFKTQTRHEVGGDSSQWPHQSVKRKWLLQSYREHFSVTLHTVS